MSFQYDASGNMTRIQDVSRGSTWSLTYDESNRVMSIYEPGMTAFRYRYRYNADGQRYHKQAVPYKSAPGPEMPGRSYLAGTKAKENFTGHERDAETGMLYAGARYYMPNIGRWTSVDPLAASYPTWSPYNYVLNNPLGNVDPDGREVRCRTEVECRTAADELNAVHEGETRISVAEAQWEEDASVWWNPFIWGATKTVSGFKLTTSNSDFDWSQNAFTSGLFDVINSDDIVFNLAMVSENFEMPRTPGWTASAIQGRNYATAGGGTVIVGKSNRLGEPVGVVLMHELVGHGHPAGGKRAWNVNDYYQSSLGYRLQEGRGVSVNHGGYLDVIGWKRTELYRRSN